MFWVATCRGEPGQKYSEINMHIISKTMCLFVHLHITVHNFMIHFGTIGARLVELPSENFYLHEVKVKKRSRKSFSIVELCLLV